MMYSIVQIPIAMVPTFLDISGMMGMMVSVAAGVLYFVASLIFFLKNDQKSARQVMFSSFIYLPTVLLALLFDKL